MEPEGPRVAPGNSCGPPGDHTGSSRTAEVSGSFSAGEERMCNSSSPWPGTAGEEVGEADQGRDHPGRDLGRDQGRGGSPRRSIPPSLTWDSDSEKETVDEEELQHFANPHGLANHSPGHTSSGLRPDGQHDQTPAHTQHLPVERDREGPIDTSDSNPRGTRTQEPNMSPPGQPPGTQRVGGGVWKVPDPPEPTRVKPKGRCQTQSEEGGERPGEEGGVHSQVKHKAPGGQAKEASPDVYSFPGDSDAESPPPAAWAQCSFTQRRRRRKALLRPFSGLAGPPPGGAAGPGRRTATPQGANAVGDEGRSAGEKEGEEMLKGGEENIGGEEPEEEEEGGHHEEDGGPSRDIFTCVECSIYFQKQVHLQEHMSEHVQGPPPGGRGERPDRAAPLHCAECGWMLPSPSDLLEHRRRHQESRARILEEIQKLGATGAERLEEVQRVEEGGIPVGLDLSAESHPATGPVKDVDLDVAVNPPTLSLVPGAVTDPSTPGPKPGPVRTPARARAAPTKGRRFICPTCNFSTKTSQAMANHAKTHNRTKPPARRKSQRAPYSPDTDPPGPSPPAAQSGATSSSTQHLHLPPEVTQTSRPILDRSRFDPGPTKELVFKCIGNRRTNRRERVWIEGTRAGPRSEGRRRGGVGGELRAVAEQKSSGRLKSHTRPAFTQDASGLTQSSAASPPLEKTVKEEEEEEEEGAEQNGRLSFLRRRNRLLAPAEEDSEEEEEDIDEEQMQRFLSEAILEEEEEEVDEETGRPRSVERRCPYCPDRFHNGIGLANHVRGHLNRVGVSYNVRHFISAEEVNAIEKKFSYQKKRKKVANFDPDTFSVMRCEFCGAGFDTRAGLSSHARAHLRDFGILNWDVTVSPISILREMFSSRPDLVIPTAPPRSPPSPGPLDPCGDDEDDEDDEEEDEEEEEEEEEEQGRGKRVKLEEESGGGGGGVAGAKVARNKFRVLPPAWSREEEEEEEGEPGGHAGGLEADDETLFRIPGSDAVVSSAPEEADDKAAPDLTCRVCSLRFETRRGLSSHARSHLRQLGVSEGSGAPINLLYRVIQERLGPPDPAAPGRDPDLEDDMDFEEKPLPLSILAKMAPSPSPSSSLTSVLMGPPGAYPPRLLSSVVRKAPVSSLLPVSSPLRSPDHKGSGVKAVTSHLSLAGTVPSTKPFWAPQESDAPLNLTLEGDPSKDIICHLCGAWFETRKGLSSHARAHLRHFGVEYSESKGSPITLLNQLIHTDDFKHKASVLQATPPGPQGPASKRPLLASSLLFKGAGGSPSSKATSMSSLLGPPAKRPKSSIQVFRLSSGELLTLPHNEPPKEIGCEFCGEFFENRKGLSSHARSHLRQMGITEWSVNGSPIDTLREVIAKRGLPCALPLKPRKTPPPSSPGPPRSPLAAASSSPPASAPLLGRLPFAFARPSSPHPPAGCRTSRATPPSAPPLSSSEGVVLKPKPEPEPLEVTMPGAVGASGGLPAEPLNCSWNSSDNMLPLNLVVSHETEPPREIQCEFCGEFFENRKGLSSHARSHLRQMGITEWSVNGSPIDTLREVMTKRGDALPPVRGVKKEAGRRGAASPVWGDPPGGPGSSEGPGGPGFQLTKFRKSPLSLLHSRLQKQSAAVGGLAPGGKGLQGPPLGSRAPLEEPGLAGQAPPLLPKALAALPPGFLFKRKGSPDKHGASPQDASCELCGFYFENRKALASHARAHLRQFGVTEWCVNGSPIETLSAWMRTRPQKVLEMHRSYMQVNRSSLKKVPPPPFRKVQQGTASSLQESPSFTFGNDCPNREVIQKLLTSLVSVVLCELVSPWFSSLTLVCSSSWQKNVSPLSPSSDHLISIPALKPSSSSTSSGSSPWSSLAPPRLPRSDRSEFLSPPLHATPKAGPGGRSPSRQGPSLPLHAQVARSELNVRLPRGFERRPLKHPSLPEGAERESAPRPPRSGTIPSLVPHPPSYPLVKLVGALYTLKCRFCEVEFQGPLSIQEDWIRHLQQHIIKMNYSKPDGPRGPASTDPPTPRGPASTDPPTPRGPVSTDPTTPKGPASTDLATPRGPASTDPTPPRGPASTDPPTPRGSASSDTKTPKGPTSNGPAPPSGLSSPQPATLRAPGSTDPPTHRGATDPPTQPPASTNSAPPGGPRSTHPAVPRAPPPPSPPAAPHSAQAEGLSAGAPAQDEEGSSPEEGPIPDGGPPACVSTSSTAAAVAPPSDPPSQRPPAQGVPTVPGPQGPEFPEEQPMTDSAPAPAPGPAP
ncbi:protein Wiz [Gadus chalcogrammus]|uniref:protein Wiz n=1 Tax=Gadus chalcogrammus TaxID=1042646 RepID=UPI0024C336D6|nr:protein Wiz [Gadus chalcogrammus]